MRRAMHATFREPSGVLTSDDSPIPQPGAGKVLLKP